MTTQGQRMALRRQMFAKAFAKGVTYEEIAKAMGVTRRMLFYYRGALSLPRRPKGRRPGKRGVRK